MGEFVIKMPDVGEGVAEAELVEWHVKPGDPVVLYSRYGERLDHARRSREAVVEAVARYPQLLYALRGEVSGWTGAIATTLAAAITALS